MLIVCNGMPRSGSTLQYNLARTLVEKMGVGEGHGYFDQPTELGSRLLEWSNDDGYHVAKTHAVHPEIIVMTASGSACITYIYRDIRDVAVSLKRAFKVRREEALLRTLDTAITSHYSIKSIKGEVLWQKYEHTVANVPDAVWTQAKFLGLEPTESIVSEVADECSIENSRRVAESISRDGGLKTKLLPWLHRVRIRHYAYDRERTLLHHNHISSTSGSTNIWRKELKRHEANLLTERYKEWLQEEGYEL